MVMSAPAPSSTTTSSSLFSSVITPKIISGNRSQKKVNNKHGSDKTTIQAKTFTMMPSVTSRLKKNISRTKEKILQGIGKTDRTADESFDLYVENFDRQHTQAAKLTKELNRYISSLKETQKASKNFYDALRETYESNWPEHQDFVGQVDIIEHKWTDYIQTLVNDVHMPLISYLNEFPELKKKIEKRDNRLLDYDNARHNLESVQHKNNKKHSSATLSSNSTGTNSGMPGGNSSSSTSTSSTEQLTKLTKLKIDLEDKQHVYEEINQTLCMTLPVLFENRIKFYSSLFQTFFYTETIFHSDCVEVKSKLDTMCENLSKQTTQQISDSEGLYYAKICQDHPSIRSPELPGFTKITDDANKIQDLNESIEYKQSTFPPATEASTLEDRQNLAHLPANIGFIETTNSEYELSDKVNIDQVTLSKSDQLTKTELVPNNESIKPVHTKTSKINSASSTPPEYDATKLESIESFLDKSLKHLIGDQIALNNESTTCIDSEKMQQPIENIVTVTDLKIDDVMTSRTVYKVRATYAYEAKELDELTFLKEDVIEVVEGTESENEDLDEGWLIGVHEATLKRGLFPANFTKRV